MLIPVLLGLIVQLVSEAEIPRQVYMVGITVFAVPGWWVSKWAASSYGFRWVFGIWAFVMLFAVAFFLCQQHHHFKKKDHFSIAIERGGILLVQLLSAPEEKPNSFQLMVSVLAFGSDSITLPVEGNLMIYLQKDSLASSLLYGDRILIPNQYDTVRPSLNPNAFDYKKFLSRKNIFHSVYLPSDAWYLTEDNQGNLLISASLSLRNQALNIFSKSISGDRERALISALLLGYRDSLDPEMRQEFAGAGAMHILCVSGLHVGIIFLVLQHVFGFLGRQPGGRIIQAILILGCIWVYAAVTGFSPSVLRSASMFTFVVAGRTVGRKTNIYNTLSASALLLVLADPFMITQIGFQLSYLAVIGIVSLQPHMEKMLRLKCTIFRKAWAIVTVSVAAQLATGPLALHYFNQFPNYFLLTNIWIIPLSALVIYLGLATLALHFVPFAGHLCAQLLSLFLKAMLEGVRWVEGLPFSVTNGVFIPWYEVLVVMILIVFTSLFLVVRSRAMLLSTLVLGLLFVVSISVRRMQNHMREEFVVYHIPRATVMDFQMGNTVYSMVSEGIADNPSNMDFYVESHRVARGYGGISGWLTIEDPGGYQSLHLLREGPFLLFGSITILLPGANWQLPAAFGSNDSLPVHWPQTDYIVLAGNPQINLSEWLKAFRPGKVVIDASNSPWNVDRWVRQCMEESVEVWDISSKGAYIGRRKSSYMPRISGTSSGTSMVRTIPWARAKTATSLPELCRMTGRVVSMLVAPAPAIGASFPNK